MTKMVTVRLSLRNRLLVILAVLVAMFSLVLFVSMRTLTGQAVSAAQDGLLKAAAVSILEKVRISDGALFFDLPYDTFTILGSIGEDRIFYRIDADSTFLTGYEDMPILSSYGDERTPAFVSIDYLGEVLRVAAIEKPVLVEGQSIRIRVLIGQTSNFQAQLLSQLTENLLIIVLSFCLFAALLAVLTVNSMLNPIRRLADAVGRRGPNDLREVDHPTPQELAPLMTSLNDFISRLRGALKQTEIFIAEAAHHIRTPLATVKSEGELALRKARTPENRAHLRNIVRSVEQANRSATQLLDHAIVLYRTEQPDRRTVGLLQCVNDMVFSFTPAAELRDIEISFDSNIPAGLELYLDRTLLETALRNLLDNALKYSAAETTISISLETVRDSCRVSVRNRPAAAIEIDQDLMIQRFRRGSNATDVVGSGLGLAIVREVMMALGGTLAIEFEDGGSLCASLSLSLR
ncbi:MAG: sensor histidine kinase N-terminal domain-containing protein [Candidatus Puniceispirillaceae bacterium]|jgi:two-component system sensor histidine kinase TctE